MASSEDGNHAIEHFDNAERANIATPYQSHEVPHMNSIHDQGQQGSASRTATTRSQTESAQARKRPSLAIRGNDSKRQRLDHEIVVSDDICSPSPEAVEYQDGGRTLSPDRLDNHQNGPYGVADAYHGVGNQNAAGQNSTTLKVLTPAEEQTLREKRHTAMHSKFLLAEKRYRLEDLAKEGDRFAVPLLKVVEYFSAKDAERWEVINDENLSNPTAFTLPLAGHNNLHRMDLDACLSIEPRADGPDMVESWFDEHVLANMVALDEEDFVAGSWFCDPGSVFIWLTGSLSVQERVDRITAAIHGLENNGQLPDATMTIPCHDMPPDTQSVILPFNLRSHWVALKLEPDLQSDYRCGKIYLFNSLAGVPAVLDKVRKVIPLFAKLVGLRPDLDWRQDAWEVVEGHCTFQHNSTDCGPLTAKNCIELMKGGQPLVYNDATVIHDFGQQLRYEFLQNIYPLVTGQSWKSAFEGGSNRSPAPDIRNAQQPANGSKSNEDGRNAITPAVPDIGGAQSSENGSQSNHEGSSGVSPAPNFLGDREPANGSNSNPEGSNNKPPTRTMHCTCCKRQKPCGEFIGLHGGLCRSCRERKATRRARRQANRNPGGEFGSTSADVPDYRLLLCNALVAFGSLSADELTTAVATQLAEVYNVYEDEGPLQDRLRVLLEGTGFMFTADDDYGDRWNIISGPGRSVDNHTRTRLLDCKPTVDLESVQNGLCGPFDIAIAIVRASPSHKLSKSIEKDQKRCHDLWSCFWETCHDGAMPPQQDLVYLPHRFQFPRWVPWYDEQNSSTTGLFSGQSPAGKPIRELLELLNTHANSEGVRVNIRLIVNGWDGATTNNDCWQGMIDEWPSLDFGLSIVVPSSVTPEGLSNNSNENAVTWTVTWRHYDVSKLAQQWSGADNTPVDMIEPQLRMFAVEESPEQFERTEALRLYHEQFLLISQMINCLKLDFSLCKVHLNVGISPHLDNGLARKFTSCKRNRFELVGDSTYDEEGSHSDEDEQSNGPEGSGGLLSSGSPPPPPATRHPYYSQQPNGYHAPLPALQHRGYPSMNERSGGYGDAPLSPLATNQPHHQPGQYPQRAPAVPSPMQSYLPPLTHHTPSGVGSPYPLPYPLLQPPTRHHTTLYQGFGPERIESSFTQRQLPPYDPRAEQGVRRTDNSSRMPPQFQAPSRGPPSQAPPSGDTPVSSDRSSSDDTPLSGDGSRTSNGSPGSNGLAQGGNGSQPSLSCGACGDSFNSVHDLAEHISSHKSDSKWHCTPCNKNYNCKRNYINHVRDYHAWMLRYQCSHCPTKLLSQRDLNHHASRQHGHSELPYPCPSCDKTFRVPGRRERHIKQVHGTKK